MSASTRFLTAFLVACVAGAHAQEAGREVMDVPAPVEPSSLSIIPTARVTRSLDLDISGAGVFLGSNTSMSRGSVKMGVGDIAEIEMSTMAMLSSLKRPNHLSNVPGGGLKVAFPVWQYWKGMAVGFRRSGGQKARVGPDEFEQKVGEFYSVASLANYRDEAEGASVSGGWMGTKVKAHLGLGYLAARLASDRSGMEKKTFLRPFGGLEIWRGRASVPQTRVMAEFGWLAHFEDPNRIEDVWVASGGIRFFFHRYASLDIGVRYQSNYDGLSESTLQTQFRLGWPTHLIRDRIIGI